MLYLNGRSNFGLHCIECLFSLSDKKFKSLKLENHHLNDKIQPAFCNITLLRILGGMSPVFPQIFIPMK